MSLVNKCSSQEFAKEVEKSQLFFSLSLFNAVFEINNCTFPVLKSG